MSHTTTSSAPHPCMQFKASMLWHNSYHPIQALVDSGADDSFIDSFLMVQAQTPLEALPAPKMSTPMTFGLTIRIFPTSTQPKTKFLPSLMGSISR